MSKPQIHSLAVSIIAKMDGREQNSQESTEVPVTTASLATQKPTESIQAKQAEVKAEVETKETQKAKEIYNFLYGYKDIQNSNYFRKVEGIQECSAIPPNLVGEIKVFQDHFPMEVLAKLDFHVKPGGTYIPSECKARQSVAIVIPFRNRDHHLSVLLLNLHPFLQKQQIEYTIFIVNQIEGSKFNRAMLLNVGFMEAMKLRKYDCAIFHDVDLIPQNDQNIYICPDDNPRHMSVAIDKFNYQLPYKDILGGIVAMKSELFVKVNGYSNQFFGWGGEDDDFSSRCRNNHFTIIRYPANVARYQMIKHDLDKGNEANPQRFDMLKHVSDRQDHDGLNSLTYQVVSIEELPLYTKVNVKVNQADVMNAQAKPLPKFPWESS